MEWKQGDAPRSDQDKHTDKCITYSFIGQMKQGVFYEKKNEVCFNRNHPAYNFKCFRETLIK